MGPSEAWKCIYNNGKIAHIIKRAWPPHRTFTEPTGFSFLLNVYHSYIVSTIIFITVVIMFFFFFNIDILT